MARIEHGVIGTSQADAPEVDVVVLKEPELTGWQPLEETIPKEIRLGEVQAWARRIKVEPKQIHIGPMSRKWGSCSAAGSPPTPASCPSRMTSASKSLFTNCCTCGCRTMESCSRRC